MLDELLKQKAINQDICISHFQIYLINEGSLIDPATYASLYHLLDEDGDFNMLGYLIADENDISIIYSFNKMRNDIGRKNIVAAYFNLINWLKMDLGYTISKTLEDIILYVFLHHDYLNGTMSFNINDHIFEIRFNKYDMHYALLDIFNLYHLEYQEVNVESYKVKDGLYLIDLNSICDKINI